MNSFLANLNKEFTEIKRNGKLVVIIILFFAFGVMNPAVAKLTPWLLEVMSESMAESGMVVTEVKVDALTSWTQFFKNIPMALIAFVLMFAGIFTKEYEKGTLIPILARASQFKRQRWRWRNGPLRYERQACFRYVWQCLSKRNGYDKRQYGRGSFRRRICIVCSQPSNAYLC